MGHPLGAGHAESPVPAGREEAVFPEVQRERPHAGRLREPHDRVQHRPAERLAVRQRYPGDGRHESRTR